MTLLRQTAEGSIMIGDSKGVGFDISSSIDIMAQIADRARRTLPVLENNKSYVVGQHCV